MNLELFRALGVIKDYPDLDRITEQAYMDLEEKVWKENLDSSPHGRPWFTSFHASGFPEEDKPCGRKALYTMLDTPEAKPFSPFLRAVSDIGQAVEYQIVYRWAKAGKTLGIEIPEYDGEPIEQVKLEDPETWLTGSIDSILDLRPEFDSVLPVDVKSKNHDVVEQMKMGQLSYEDKHFNQVQAYMYLCNLFHEKMGWDKLGLNPAKGAFIYYASRQDPRTAKEFYIPIDWEFINNGVEQLKEWKQHFINETLPQRDKSWRWTEQPCKWCPFKKEACKPDNKEKILQLDHSKAIVFAKSLRTNYNYKEIRKEVLERWGT